MVATPLASERVSRNQASWRASSASAYLDAWVASADNDSGIPYLVSLWFLWDRTKLPIATTAARATGRNRREEDELDGWDLVRARRRLDP